MILLDSNLLIYACVDTFPQHKFAKTWLDETLTDSPRIGLPWPTLLSFVRIISNPRIFERPTTIEKAWRITQEWLELPNTWIPEPTERHAEVLGKLLRSTAHRANLVPDAHLAAIAIEQGLELLSTDGDFARFPGLQWRNPLQTE